MKNEVLKYVLVSIILFQIKFLYYEEKLSFEMFAAKKIELKAFPSGYRGVFAGENIKKGEVFYRVPGKYMLTDKNSELSAFCKSYNLESVTKKDLCHVGFLLATKNNKNSIFYNYISELPQDVSWHSLAFKGEERELAAQSFAFEFIKDRQVKEVKIRDELREKGLEFTDEEFLIALINKKTRVFSVDDKRSGMGPYADMINTNVEEKQNTQWDIDTESHELTFSTTKDVKKGEELFINYLSEDWSNSGFMKYGFTLEQESPKFKIEDAFHYSKDKKACHKVSLSFPADYNTFELDKFAPCFPTKNSKKDIHKQGLKMIRNSIEKRLKKYTTKISEDFKKVKTANISENMRNIIRVLIEDKKCLISNLKLINKKLKKSDHEEILF